MCFSNLVPRALLRGSRGGQAGGVPRFTPSSRPGSGAAKPSSQHPPGRGEQTPRAGGDSRSPRGGSSRAVCSEVVPSRRRRLQVRWPPSRRRRRSRSVSVVLNQPGLRVDGPSLAPLRPGQACACATGGGQVTGGQAAGEQAPPPLAPSSDCQAFLFEAHLPQREPGPTCFCSERWLNLQRQVMGPDPRMAPHTWGRARA